MCVCVCVSCYLLVDLCRCDFLQASLNLRRTWLSECCVIIFFLSQNHSQKVRHFYVNTIKVTYKNSCRYITFAALQYVT